VMHGDIKSDNVLVVPPAEGQGGSRVRLVDWELAQVGDAAWDVAGMLQDFVMFWVLSMPGDAASADEMANRARYPISALQPAVRAFWRAYRDAAGLAAGEAEATLRRAVRFAGARLIQSAYEMGQASHALPRASVLLLQISANLLAQPELGQVQLFGLYHEVAYHA
jgi:aminoglycoside phosphotransferase (APT) family kinase protein